MTTETPLDCYKVLGIARDATLRQVKAAYRKLAKRHHPDACPGDPEAAARFRDITDAYTRLVRPGTAPGLRPQSSPPAPRPPDITALGRVPGRQPPAGQVLEDTWLRSAATTARSRRSSSSSPAAPTAGSPNGATTPPAAGTPSNVKHAEVMISGEGLARTPARGPRHAPARGRPRPGRRPRHHGHQPTGPLPQQAIRRPAPTSSAWTSPRHQRFGWSATTDHPTPPPAGTPTSSALSQTP